MLNGVYFFLLRKIESWLFLCLKFRDKLSFLFFSHLLVFFEKPYLFCELFDLFFIFLHQSFDGFDTSHPFSKDLLSKLNWISCTNETPTQEYVSIFFEYFLKVDIICSFNVLLFIALLFFVFHEIEVIIRLFLLSLLFIVNVVL